MSAAARCPRHYHHHIERGHGRYRGAGGRDCDGRQRGGFPPYAAVAGQGGAVRRKVLLLLPPLLREEAALAAVEVVVEWT